MFAKIIVILSITVKIIDGYYLEAESNFLKPKLERNNVVNKGIWVRNNAPGSFMDKNALGNFIFRPNSIDIDNVIQNNFDTFGQNAMQDTPFVSSYVQRTRRSPDHIRKRRPRKSMKSGKIIKSSIDDSVMIKSKLVSDLKPTSVFNEYPYEVAILLNNEEDKANDKAKQALIQKELSDLKLNEVENNTYATDVDKQESIKEEEYKIIPLNSTDSIVTDSSKRSKKFDYADEGVNNFKATEDNNKSEAIAESNKKERDYLEKNNVWKHSSPAHDNTFYKVVPKEPEKLKPVTERGLIKVISMLTKTFKKIMKQHNEIKNIHDKLLDVNKNFDQKISEMTSKFEDFDSKYSDMIQFNNKLKNFESELKSQKEYFDNKQKEIHNSFTEFQEQQKKFLLQQRQFYSIQKLMLAQNEKINEKQNLIAQTQSQISHRQNNFARILKKAKQIINENKAKPNNSFIKQQDKVAKVVSQTNVLPISTTARIAPSTEAMKINLFSIPTKNRIENQDAQIIQEKDDKQIDDLVYKYYFNNTFIDSLIKSKILNNFASSGNSVEIVNRRSNDVRSKLSKIKRDELETTLMIPVNNSLSDTPNRRERRWINHFSKNKYKRLNRHRKETTNIIDANKETTTIKNHINKNIDQDLNDVEPAPQVKTDPFLNMATNFCKEIKQNGDEQSLKWCIEKALRRLRFMEINAFTPPPVTVMVKQEPQMTVQPTDTAKINRAHGISTLNIASPVTVQMAATQPPTTSDPIPRVTPLYIVSTPTQAVFFPDNDELESNLNQFDLKPDTEGNVYFDGSVHVSDYGHLLQESDPTSDIMPGLMDSNSKVDIDPMTFDIQAKRRAYVRKMNENILKQIRQKKTNVDGVL